MLYTAASLLRERISSVYPFVPDHPGPLAGPGRLQHSAGADSRRGSSGQLQRTVSQVDPCRLLGGHRPQA